MTTLLLLATLSACPLADANGDNRIAIDEIVRVVGAALEGCPPNPSPTPTSTRLPTPTPGGRFVHTQSIVRDTQTGLVWEARGCTPEAITYAQGVERAAEFNRRRVGGKRNWRIPTVDEWWTVEEGSRPATGFYTGQCPCEPPSCNQGLPALYYSSTPSLYRNGYDVVYPEDWETDPGYESHSLEVRLVAGP